MDKKIIAYYDEGQQKELRDILDENDDNQLDSLINSRAIKGKGDPVALIRAILHGSPSDRREGINRRLHIFKHCITLLRSQELSSKVSSELVGLLMIETDAFPSNCLAELASLFVDSIKNGIDKSWKSLELFPKILSAISVQDLVSYEEKEMKGQEYKSHILNTLCSGRWDSQSVIHLAAMFKDVPMSSEELKFVMIKIMRMFKEIELQELPPLVYQLLLMSTKGHKKLIIEGIVSFFVQQDANFKHDKEHRESELSESSLSHDQLMHVEGTVILHITFAMKQDQDLGREFIKYIKSGQQSQTSHVLAPFNVALALSTARIHRFEEQIFEFLKGTILKTYKDSERQTESEWVREMVPESCDVADTILDTVQNSVYGWDHVTQGLVQLGFLLMDSFGPKAAFGKIVTITPTAHLTPNQKACRLGSKILKETFKAHEMVRSDILEQILNRVVTKATVPVSHFIDLLADTIKSAPQILLDSLPKVREAFDYLSFLPPPTATGLLQAVQPLMKISMSLKDGLILVLRKAMFSRQLDARKIAVSGFLMILKNFKVLGSMPCSQSSQASFSLSQVQVDIHTPLSQSGNEALCLEILGNLRRSLSQQAEVRLTLYEGLYEVLSRNTHLSNPILGILLQQMKRYYETADDVNPPIKLEPCIIAQGEEVYLGEPLAHLLSCIVQCTMKTSQIQGEQSDKEEEEDEHLPEIEAMLESITRRMIKSEMEDFELDKSADFTMANSVGVKNNIFAILVLGSYEVLMEYAFTTGNYEVTACEEVLHLYQNYHKLFDIVKDKGNSGTGKKGKTGNGGAKAIPKSLLSLRFVTLMLKALYSDVVPDHQECLTLLRDNQQFVKYILNVALQKLQQINDKGSCDGTEGHNTEKIFKYCCSIGRVLLKQYSNELQKSDDGSKGKNVSTLCLEGFTALVNIMNNRFKDKLFDFLNSIDPNRDSGAGVEKEEEFKQIHGHIKKYQRMVISILTSEDEDKNLKEAAALITIIGLLSKHLQFDGKEFEQVQNWLQKICAEHNVDDSATTKVLMSQLLTLSMQQKSIIPLMREMAQDVHSKLGDIDQEIEVEDESTFAIINQRTAAPTVIVLLLNQIERELDDTEWVINKLKAGQGNSLGTGDVESPGKRESIEKSICTRLGHSVNTFHELSQSAMPVGICADSIVKMTTKLYGTLTLLVKYYLQLYNQRAGHISNRFEKLVKLSGTNLSPYIYAMITYIQASQNVLLQQAVGEGKKKKGDKKKNDIGKATAMKEAKMIPNLIFAIEQYEKFLIQLSKKSKVNLMEHIKLSTSRDFRINTATLQAALEQQSSEDENMEEDENSDEDAEQENQAPPQKKAKVTQELPTKKGKLGIGGKGRKGKGLASNN